MLGKITWLISLFIYQVSIIKQNPNKKRLKKPLVAMTTVIFIARRDGQIMNFIDLKPYSADLNE